MNLHVNSGQIPNIVMSKSMSNVEIPNIKILDFTLATVYIIYKNWIIGAQTSAKQ